MLRRKKGGRKSAYIGEGGAVVCSYRLVREVFYEMKLDSRFEEGKGVSHVI